MYHWFDTVLISLVKLTLFTPHCPSSGYTNPRLTLKPVANKVLIQLTERLF